MFGTLRLHLNRLSAKHKAAGTFDDAAETARALRFYNLITTKLMNAERASIFIVEPESRKIWLKSGTGVPEHGIEVEAEGSIVGQVIQTGEPALLTDLEHEEGAHRQTDRQTGFTTHNMICVPITDPAVGESIGAIQALNKKDGLDFDTGDLELLNEVATQLRARVSRIYLDQEIYGLSEKVLQSARRTLKYLAMGVALLMVLLLILMAAWLVIPAMG